MAGRKRRAGRTTKKGRKRRIPTRRTLSPITQNCPTCQKRCDCEHTRDLQYVGKRAVSTHATTTFRTER